MKISNPRTETFLIKKIKNWDTSSKMDATRWIRVIL